MRMHKFKLVAQGVALGLGLLTASNAIAQDEDNKQETSSNGGVEQITVTAEKRSASIKDVPIAIQAISEVQIERLPINNVQDLVTYVPSLRADNPGNSAMTAFTLRGVGQRDVNLTGEGAVAFFMDGGYVSFLSAIGQPIYDVERVEVLKGPQGTLFGRNATGGLIHVMSKKPSFGSEGYFNIAYGSYNDTTVEGAVNSELSDSLAVRASLKYHYADGYLENETGPDQLQDDSLAGRLQFLYEPNADFSLLLSGRFWKVFKSPGAGVVAEPYVLNAEGEIAKPTSASEYEAFCAAISGGVVVPPEGAWQNGSCYAAQPEKFKGSWGNVSFFETDYYSFTANADWSINDTVTLVSVSDYQHIEAHYRANVSAEQDGRFSIDLHSEPSKQFSQELRLDFDFDTTQFVTGVYFLTIDHDVRTNANLYNIPGLGLELPAEYTQESDSYAVFAQVDYEINDELTFALGARAMYDEKNIHNESTCTPNPDFAPIGAATCEVFGTVVFPGALAFNNTYTDEFDEWNWSGKAVLTYQPNKDVTIYGGINRGVKGAGFNSGSVQFYNAELYGKFDSETIISYETGIKASVFDNKLYVDSSIFYYDYSDYQAFSSTPSTGLLTINVDAEIRGAELTLRGAPIEGFTYTLGATYLDTEQKNVPLAEGEYGNFQMPGAPELTTVAELRYGVPVKGDDELAFQINAIYQSERSISAIDWPVERLPSYTRVDARLEYNFPGDQWSVAAYVNNLTDEYIIQQRIDFATLSGNAYDIPERPRWYGLEVRYRYY